MARSPITSSSEASNAGLDVRPSLGTRRGVDELWDAWTLAEVEAGLALGAWRSASVADQPRAHAIYAAALRLEEQAALTLALRLRPRVGRRLANAA